MLYVDGGKVEVLMIRRRFIEDYMVDAGLVILLLSAGFIFNLWVFFRSRLITGIDGPYYLIQVKSLLEKGSLVYGDPPLTFLLLALFSLLAGDVMVGVKVGTSFLCALSTVPAYFIMRGVTGRRAAGLYAMLLIIFSAPYVRMMTDFIKNAVGIFFLLLFLYYLHNLASSRSSKLNIFLSSLLLVLTGMTHILDFGVALLYLALYVISTLLFNRKSSSFLLSAGVILSVALVFSFVAYIFFNPLFTDFNKFISFLHDLFSPQRRYPPPHPILKPKRPLPVVPFSLPIIGGWGVIVSVLLSGAILSLYLWMRKDKESFLLLFSSTVMGIIMCFPLIPSKYLGRFMLMFLLPSFIIVSYSISFIDKVLRRKVGSLIPFIISFLIISLFVMQGVNVAFRARSTITYSAYLDLVDMKKYLPPNSIIIVSKRIGYWVQYIDEVEVSGFSPVLWRLYPHVFGLYFKDKTPNIPSSKIVFVGRIFVLVELPPPRVVLERSEASREAGV